MKFNFTASRWIFLVPVLVFCLLLKAHAYGQTNSTWESEVSGPETFWGAQTNGVKVALLISPLSSSNNAPIRCTPIIKSSVKSTNRLNTINVYFPPFESCCQISLKDENGNTVSKTQKGKLLGGAITEPLMVKIGGINYRAGYRMRPVAQNHSEILSDFSFALQDYFEITNSGKYRLTYEMRIVLPQSTKGNYMTLHTTNLPMTTLPSVIADVEIKCPAGK